VSAVTNDGRTALHYAASKGRTKVAGILIERGAKVNQKDKVGV
jgi:26S proteasome non-ATPase regulatory subunit 10